MVILFWALAFLDMVSAFPSGPPNTRVVCQEMFPFGHGVDAQSSPPPYRIDISQNIYTANEKIRGKNLYGNGVDTLSSPSLGEPRDAKM